MTTPRLATTELIAKQAQPHVPVNAALRRIEQGASRFVVISATLSAPPSSPADGAAYLVAATPAATGAWLGKEKNVAYYSGTGWLFIAPLVGFEAMVPGGSRYFYTAGSPALWVEQAAAGATPVQCITIACSDETTALTVGTAKVTFRMPYAFTLTAVRASLTTAPTGSTLVVDINEGGVSILSTKLSIDATEKTSTTAATLAAFSDTALADDAEITIDIDQIGSTIAGAGLKVCLIGTKT